jgi:drug/metabolite transporter (DMT)-like permease
VLLGEPLSARAIVGGVVVLVGVWLTSRVTKVAHVTQV